MTDVDRLLTRRTLPPPTVAKVPAAPTARLPVTTSRRRRRHPAKGARIAAAGLGVSTMLGLVATMGLGNALSTVPSANTPPPTTPASGTATTTATSPITSRAAPAPITLTARPEVLVVTPPAARTPAAAPAPAPVATTRGSN